MLAHRHWKKEWQGKGLSKMPAIWFAVFSEFSAPVLVSAYISMRVLFSETGAYDVFSFLLALILILFYIAILAGSFLVARRCYLAEREHFLLEDLKTSSLKAALFQPISFLRIFMILVIIFHLRKHTIVALVLLEVVQVLFLLYFVVVCPYKEKKDNLSGIVMELSILAMITGFFFISEKVALDRVSMFLQTILTATALLTMLIDFAFLVGPILLKRKKMTNRVEIYAPDATNMHLKQAEGTHDDPSYREEEDKTGAPIVQKNNLFA